MKIRKVFFLLVAFLLPLSVFLFLKYFGKNKFEVAPLFQTSHEIPEGCEGNYTFPYFLPDSLNKQIPVQVNELLVISFRGGTSGKSNESDNQLNRMKEEFSGDEIAFIALSEDSDVDIDILKRCVFLLRPEQDVVLIDRERRVRGQYDGTSLEEMDRLMVEMKIILNKY